MLLSSLSEMANFTTSTYYICKLIDVYLKEIIVQYKMNDHLTLSLLISILRRNFDSIISFLRTIL
ncbi:hypothetical protein NQ317_009033 [Molorchus minor]|uniref:Uncharacterized protein n=1 Tax=Molorchus minor TaxID=1323400 RepID=A0ABQ9J1S8_9CUCU|nr:hypothetical protein NQ317_009033 [Molorchus minor]